MILKSEIRLDKSSSKSENPPIATSQCNLANRLHLLFHAIRLYWHANSLAFTLTVGYIKITPKYSTDRRYVYLFVYFLHLYLKQGSKQRPASTMFFRMHRAASWNAVACFGGVLELFIRCNCCILQFFHILGKTTNKTRPDYEFGDAAVLLCLGTGLTEQNNQTNYTPLPESCHYALNHIS